MASRTLLLLFLVLAAATTGTSPDAAAAVPLPPHPRLRLSQQRLGELRAVVASDPVAAGMYESIHAAGTRLLAAKPLACNISGPGGLLGVAGGAVNRIYTLAFLYRYSQGNTTWSARAIEEMLAVATFPTWNPPHFLDTAEMSHAMAIGYDWVYEAIAVPDRRAIEAAVLKHGVHEYLNLTSGGNEWARGDWNWNQVVNGGLTVAALSFADATETAGLAQAAADTLERTRSALKLAFASYAPQGAWPEGAGYWGYGTRYALTASTSLATALGSDGGLSAAEGFKETGEFCIHHLGPATRTVFNWADADENACESVNLMQLAALFPSTAATYAPTARALIDGYPSDINHQPGSIAAKSCSSWYRGTLAYSCVISLLAYSGKGSVANLSHLLPLDYLFERRAVGFFRGSWTDRNTSWLGFKGVNSTADHGDLDGGTFVLEMGGQRWAIDLGSGNYGLKGYWTKESKEGARYSYYRKSTRGHNTLTFGGWDGRPWPSNQLVGGPETMISEFVSNESTKSATVDLTSAYSATGASAVVRHFAWDSPTMQELTISDTIQGADRGLNVTWAMHTRANISLHGPKAVLSQGGVELVARLLEPPGAVFSSAEVDLQAPQKSSAGIRKLLVEQPHATALDKMVVALSLAKGA